MGRTGWNWKRLAAVNLHMMGPFVAKVYTTTSLRRPPAGDKALIESALTRCCREEVDLTGKLDELIYEQGGTKLIAVWIAQGVQKSPKLTLHSSALYGKPSSEIKDAVHHISGSKAGSFEIFGIRSGIANTPRIGRMLVFNILADLMSRRGRAGFTVQYVWWYLSEENPADARKQIILKTLRPNGWRYVRRAQVSPLGDPELTEACGEQRLWYLHLGDEKTRNRIAKTYSIGRMLSGSVCGHGRVANADGPRFCI